MGEKRRPKGEGSIYQLPNETWRGKIPASETNDGKIKYFTGKTQIEVSRKMKEYKNELAQATLLPDKIYFDTAIKYWLYNIKIHELKPSSMDRLESTINTHILPIVGSLLLQKVTPEIIEQKILNAITKDGKSHSTVKKVYDALNSFYSFYDSRNNTRINPMKTISPPKQKNYKTKDIRYFTEAEKEKFINACKFQYENGEYCYSYGFVFILMIYTGIRGGEAIQVRWEDIDLEHKLLFVKGNRITVKDRSENKFADEDNGIELKYITINQDTAKSTASTKRQVPLNSNAVKAIEGLKAVYLQKYGHVPPEFLVSTKDGQPITLSTFLKSFKKILERADIDIKGCGIHTLRHTCASLMFKNGVDVKTVSEILGHSSVAITYNTYIHLIQEQKAKAMDLIDF
ncbi:MAG: tyrosine-type recombinase/integrase [Angelakisella sp.]